MLCMKTTLGHLNTDSLQTYTVAGRVKMWSDMPSMCVLVVNTRQSRLHASVCVCVCVCRAVLFTDASSSG